MPAAQAQRALDRHGQSATLRTYTEGTKDDYEDASTSSNESTISVIRQTRTQPTTVTDERGKEHLVEVDIFVDSSLGVAVRGETRRPEIDIGSDTYAVFAVDPDNGGLDRLFCRRVR